MSIKHLILSVYSKIANTNHILLDKVEQPNDSLENGIFNDNLASMPQVNLLAIKIQKPDVNININTSDMGDTNKGAIYIPDSKDYYMGEGTVK